MSNVKLNCSFCGKTNTKIEEVRSGIFGNDSILSKKIGEKEVIDNRKEFYRCTDCGRILCYSCLNNMGGRKKGLFSTSYSCPKCNSKIIKI